MSVGFSGLVSWLWCMEERAHGNWREHVLKQEKIQSKITRREGKKKIALDRGIAHGNDLGAD